MMQSCETHCKRYAQSSTRYPSLTLPAGSLPRIWSIPSLSLTVFHHSLSTFIKSSNMTAGKMTMPAKTVRRCGCSLRTYSVQTPKFEPPPRMAQNRPAFSESLTVRAVPFAVTTVAYIWLSRRCQAEQEEEDIPLEGCR